MLEMRPQCILVFGTLVFLVNAIPHRSLVFRQAENDTTIATIPQNDPNSAARAAAVAKRKAGFVYGPSLVGEAAFFLNGTLGNERVQADLAAWSLDRAIIDDDVGADVNSIEVAIVAVSASTFMPLDYAHSHHQS
jgi:hypothetical protein